MRPDNWSQVTGEIRLAIILRQTGFVLTVYLGLHAERVAELQAIEPLDVKNFLSVKSSSPLNRNIDSVLS